jgi:hypothetical protein
MTDPSYKALLLAFEELDSVIHLFMYLHRHFNFYLMRQLVEELNKVLLLLTVIIVHSLYTLIVQL